MKRKCRTFEAILSFQSVQAEANTCRFNLGAPAFFAARIEIW
jgi:hypothetical protein